MGSERNLHFGNIDELMGIVFGLHSSKFSRNFNYFNLNQKSKEMRQHKFKVTSLICRNIRFRRLKYVANSFNEFLHGSTDISLLFFLV